MQKPTKDDFKFLKESHGNHTKVAQCLGVTPEHYRYVRRTHKMSASLAKNIFFEVARLKETQTDHDEAA